MASTASEQGGKQTRTLGGTAELKVRGDSQFRAVIRSIRRDWGALVGAGLLVFVVLLVLVLPVVSSRSPTATNPQERLTPPFSQNYILGSDELGRDILTRIAYGGRVSLTVALVPVITALLIGVSFGLMAGYFGGTVDTIVMRLMDIMLAIPSLLLAIGIAAALGPSMRNLIIALLIVGIPTFARIVRSQVLQIRELDYVTAARALGQRERLIVARHVLPNVVAPVIVFATLETGRMIIMAAGLSFLGLGVQPPTPDWGIMLSTGRSVMTNASHVATIPGLVIFAVVIGFNLLGDGLRDALDPRLRGR